MKHNDSRSGKLYDVGCIVMFVVAFLILLLSFIGIDTESAIILSIVLFISSAIIIGICQDKKSAQQKAESTTEETKSYEDDNKSFFELLNICTCTIRDAYANHRLKYVSYSEEKSNKENLFWLTKYFKAAILDDLYTICLELDCPPEKGSRSLGFLEMFDNYYLAWNIQKEEEEKYHRDYCDPLTYESYHWHCDMERARFKTEQVDSILQRRPHLFHEGEGLLFVTAAEFELHSSKHNKYIEFTVKFAHSLLNGSEPTQKQADFLNRLQAGNWNVKSFKFLTTQQLERMAHPEKSPMGQLDSLIGMEAVKKEVRSLYNFIKVQKLRQENGIETPQLSLHCVFTGNPGTGKTTVARILVEIYEELGLLTGGTLVETDRSGLVAEYIGQTAVKTNKIIDEALGGVLFIDEAYSLISESKKDFGHEAVATLLKRMEDDRDQLSVILAGYPNEMKRFIESNPGLQSRFTRYIHFDDYKPEELVKIYGLNLQKYQYEITPDAQQRLKTVIEEAYKVKDEHFGNARWVRNLFEATLQHQANRLASLGNASKEQLQTIEAEDIQPI